jgi:hypothetical protein
MKVEPLKEIWAAQHGASGVQSDRWWIAWKSLCNIPLSDRSHAQL